MREKETGAGKTLGERERARLPGENNKRQKGWKTMQINWTEERNLTMLTDYYEFTMSNGYFLNGMKDRVAVL